MIIDLERKPTLRSVPSPTANTLSRIGERLQTAHENHLGYPYNLVGRSPVPASLAGYLVNNLGTPTSVRTMARRSAISSVKPSTG